MSDKDRLDYKIACMTTEGPPENHPYLAKVRKESTVGSVKIGPVQEELVDKGYRRILLVGFDNDLVSILERAYAGSKVQRFELVFANSTDEARAYISKDRFDYVFAPAMRTHTDLKFVVKGKPYGRKTEEIPAIKINGYDIAFAASSKGMAVFLYDSSFDDYRAKAVGAITVLSDRALEEAVKEHESRCSSAFLISRKEKSERLKQFLKKKRGKEGLGSTEMLHVLN